MSNNKSLNKDIKEFCLRFKQVRKAKGLNQTQYASLLGTGQSKIAAVETLKNEPTKNMIKALTKLDVDINWLLTGRGDMFLEPEEEKMVAESASKSDKSRFALMKIINHLEPDHLAEVLRSAEKEKQLQDLKKKG